MIKELATKCHVYLGLLFLVDIWLFSLTGLFLNHPTWAVNDYREHSKWVESVTPVVPVEEGDPLQRAAGYMEQLGFEGELLGLRDDSEKGKFRFDINRPGQETKVMVDVKSGKAQIREKKTDVYGVLNQLHIFGEMKRFSPQKEGISWFAARVWVATMDGLAIALIIMVLTGFYMWLNTKRIVTGAISLFFGVSVTCFFLFL